MRETIAKGIFIKNLARWTLIFFCCVMALGRFAQFFAASTRVGEEIFWPGILILVGGVFALLVFSLTRVIKYVKCLRK